MVDYPIYKYYGCSYMDAPTHEHPYIGSKHLEQTSGVCSFSLVELRPHTHFALLAVLPISEEGGIHLVKKTFAKARNLHSLPGGHRE